MAKPINSPLGVVETRYFTFGSQENPLILQNGQSLWPVTLAYQTYGELNRDRSNAILICHALSGDSHVAGNHAEDGRLGWWELLIGPGKAFDTDRYFIVCANVIGGCKGSTGPSSINPATGKPYALSFPIITIEDMVRSQKCLLEYLGIKRLLSVVGGSMGGMQALAWCKLYPEMVVSAIPIATSPYLTAQGLAWDEIGRRAIMSDPNWDNGNYYESDHPRPEKGLAIARMIGHVTYLSDESMTAKFGRKLQNGSNFSWSFDIDFEVESYLAHQGEIFNNRFDANSYLYITRAIDYFDLSGGTGNLLDAFSGFQSQLLFISYSTDWLYPPYQTREMVEAARANNLQVDYLEAQAPYGHDSFLIESRQQSPAIQFFLNKLNYQH